MAAGSKAGGGVGSGGSGASGAARSPAAAAPAQKSRLGRGLNSLIRVSLPPEDEIAVDAGSAPAHRQAPVVEGRAVEVQFGGPTMSRIPPAAVAPTADFTAHASAGTLPPTGTGGDVDAGGAGPSPAGGGEVRYVDRVVETIVEVSGGGAVMVPINAIRPNPHQPRRSFTEQNLRELCDSIKSNGIIQPLVVRLLAGGESLPQAERSYELIAGERRLRASKLAGLMEVPCHVKTVDALTQAQLALVENIQREDLNPMDRAEGYRVLLTQLGLTQSELAVRLGEDRSTIANYARLLELAEPVKRLVREGLLSLGHGKLLAGVNDVLEQERLAKLILAQGLSVRNLEKVILSGPVGRVEKVTVPAAGMGGMGREAHYQELEKSIARQLGMRVQLKSGRSKGKGKVTIHYGSLDQFDDLMEKLGVEVG